MKKYQIMGRWFITWKNNGIRALQDFSKYHARENLNAFIGVYTPTILTILGVIMYLHFGWMVSQVSLPQTRLIVIPANFIITWLPLMLSFCGTGRGLILFFLITYRDRMIFAFQSLKKFSPLSLEKNSICLLD